MSPVSAAKLTFFQKVLAVAMVAAVVRNRRRFSMGETYLEKKKQGGRSQNNTNPHAYKEAMGKTSACFPHILLAPF
jgi:hypothetical protein